MQEVRISPKKSKLEICTTWVPKWKLTEKNLDLTLSLCIWLGSDKNNQSILHVTEKKLYSIFWNYILPLFPKYTENSSDTKSWSFLKKGQIISMLETIAHTPLKCHIEQELSAESHISKDTWFFHGLRVIPNHNESISWVHSNIKFLATLWMFSRSSSNTFCRDTCIPCWASYLLQWKNHWHPLIAIVKISIAEVWVLIKMPKNCPSGIYKAVKIHWRLLGINTNLRKDPKPILYTVIIFSTNN